jgi:hypothetical protein
VGDDFLVTAVGVGADGRQFEPIERALASEGFAAVLGAEAVVAERVGPADGDRQERIEAEAVVVVEVFVAEAQAKDALFEEIGQRMFDKIRVAMIGEAVGEALDQVELGLDLAEQ